jgi:hypothetical protein
MPAGAAASILGAVIVAGVVSGSNGSDATPSSTADSTIPASVDTAAATNPPAVVTVETSVPVVKVPLDRTLGKGVAGEDVLAVQQRLTQLGFDPGPADGYYGDLTIRSVWAFEALVMETPSDQLSGQVTPEMWDRMQDPIKVAPRRPTGGLANHTEIYLPEQVLVVFHEDQPRLVTHISSGDGEEWCDTVTLDTDERGNVLEEPVEKQVCGISKTPGGVFKYERQVEGIRNGALGSMWNPVYFNYGIAVHGALNVPDHPASHGCIRIPMHISEYFQSIIERGERVLVWNGEEEPEEVSDRDSKPIFDYPDPNATTTTTTTTTTTVAPTTVPPPTTTTPPATTTTTPPVTTTSTTLAPLPTP